MKSIKIIEKLWLLNRKKIKWEPVSKNIHIQPTISDIILLPFTVFSFNSSQVKKSLKSSIIRFSCQLPHELPKDLKLRFLENQVRKRKFQNWVETQVSVYCALQKLIFGNSDQNLRKSRYKSFVVLSNFVHFFTFGN